MDQESEQTKQSVAQVYEQLRGNKKVLGDIQKMSEELQQNGSTLQALLQEFSGKMSQLRNSMTATEMLLAQVDAEIATDATAFTRQAPQEEQAAQLVNGLEVQLASIKNAAACLEVMQGADAKARIDAVIQQNNQMLDKIMSAVQ